MKIGIGLFCLTWLCLSCVKDKPVLAPTTAVKVNTAAGKVLIINEGNFGSANASVSMLDRDSLTIVEDYFRTVNNENLGDVVQDISRINGSYYIVVNNSGKIVVCDKDFRKKAAIEGLNSPRYITQVSPGRAYISNFKSNRVTVVDLHANTIIGQIALQGWTEKMQTIYGKVYITNMKTNYVYVIDIAADKIKDSIEVGPSSGSIVIDHSDRIWVLSSGSTSPVQSPALFCINAATDKVTRKIDLPGSGAFGLCKNFKGDTLFFVSGGVMCFPVQSTVDPFQVIAPGTSNFYGLGIDPLNSDIYVSDALDYTQRSDVHIYGKAGGRKKVLKAGVNASGFYFE